MYDSRMRFLNQARETLTGIQDASTEVIATSQFAAVALVAVAVVALVALFLSTVAVTRG